MAQNSIKLALDVSKRVLTVSGRGQPAEYVGRAVAAGVVFISIATGVGIYNITKSIAARNKAVPKPEAEAPAGKLEG